MRCPGDGTSRPRRGEAPPEANTYARLIVALLERGERMTLSEVAERFKEVGIALYEYGRLHGAVRLRWGFLDERISAPWVHRDEPTLYDLFLPHGAFQVGESMETFGNYLSGPSLGWLSPVSRRAVERMIDRSGSM